MKTKKKPKKKLLLNQKLIKYWKSWSIKNTNLITITDDQFKLITPYPTKTFNFIQIYIGKIKDNKYLLSDGGNTNEDVGLDFPKMIPSLRKNHTELKTVVRFGVTHLEVLTDSDNLFKALDEFSRMLNGIFENKRSTIFQLENFNQNEIRGLFNYMKCGPHTRLLIDKILCIKYCTENIPNEEDRKIEIEKLFNELGISHFPLSKFIL
jgi:hypothetical protein